MRRGTDDAVKKGAGGAGGGEEGESLGFMGEGTEGRMWQGKGEQKDAEMDGGQVGGKAEEEDVRLCHSVCLKASSENPPAGKIQETLNPLVIKNKTDFTSFLSVVLCSGLSVGLSGYFHYSFCSVEF